MTRNLYAFAIFFTGLFVVLDVILMVIEIREGPRVYGLTAFLPWFMFTGMMHLVGTAIMLRYYLHKKYKFAFYSGLAVFVVSACHYSVFCTILSSGNLQDWYFISVGMVLIFNLLYSAGLVVSDARERRWLRIAGVLGILIGVILIATFFWYLNTNNFEWKGSLEKVYRWMSWISLLQYVFLIMNLLEERQSLEAVVPGTCWKTAVNGFFLAIALISLSLMVVFGQKLIDESESHVPPHLVTAKGKAMASRFDARVFVSSEGDSLPYRLMKPLDYDPRKSYPMVVCLHHGGAHGRDNVNQIEGSYAPFLTNYGNLRNYPAFVFVPQCPEGFSWWTPAIDLSMMEVMQALEKEFAIDKQRLYVMGLSGGGFGSWHLIGNHPGVFAAAIPMCGGGNSDMAKNMVDVAVWAFHGDQDDLAPVSGSRDMINAIKKAGGNPRYTEFRNAGHHIGQRVQDTPGLLDWLFAQKRKDQAF